MANTAVTLDFIAAGNPVVSDLSFATDLDSVVSGVPVVGSMAISNVASYGVKYRFTFNTKLGRSVRVDVKQKNYSGDINTVQTGGPAPVVIRREPSFVNKLQTVYGTKCSIQFYSTDTFEYEEFLAQAEDEYLVSIYTDSSLYWSGFVLPDLFSLPLISKPIISLECADMLSIVSSRTFETESGTRFTGKNSFAEYLKHFFRIVNSDIDTLYDATEIRETSNPDFADSFLNLYYAHVDAFKKNLGEDNEEWFTWGEVLDAILEPIGCCLELSDGAFHITRVENKKGTYSRIPITDIKDSFTFGTSQSHNPVIEWPDQTNTWMLDRSGFVRCDDIYKEQSVNFNTGSIIQNSLVDGDFALDQWNSSTNLKRWEDDITLSYERVDAAISGVDVSYGVQINGKNTSFDTSSPTNDAIFSQPLSMQVNDGTLNTITFSIYVKTPITSGIPTNGSTIYMQLIVIVNSVTYYYDSVGNTWSSNVKYISTPSTNSYNTWKQLIIEDIPTAIGGDFSAATISAGLVKIESPEAGVQGVQFTDARIDFQVVNEYVANTTNDSSKDRSITPDPIELVLGDAPSVAYSGAISLGSDPYATKSTLWQRNGISEAKPLHQILSEVVMSDQFYNAPTLVLEATTKGVLQMNTTLKYSSLSLDKSVYFMTTGVEENMKTDTWRGEWKEIYRETYVDGVWILETGSWNDSGVWNDSSVWVDS